MFDFPMTKESLGTALFCLAVYLFMLIRNYKYALKYPLSTIPPKNKKLIDTIFVGIIFIIFCQNGDFFHMMEAVHGYDFIPGAYNYGEEVYIEIGKFTNKNYLLFRTIIWGGAFTLFCLTAKRFKIPTYYAALFIFCSYIILFTYARATLAMAVYFYGLSFLCKPIKSHKWISFIIGVIIICTSKVFHNSAIIMIIATILLLIPLKKWSIILTLISIPLITIIARNQFYTITEYALEADSDIGKRMEYYSQKEAGASGIAQLILNSLKYASFYIPLFITSITILPKKNLKEIPQYITRMYKITFGIILLASVFYLLRDNFYTMFYRILFMAMIPLTIIVVALYRNNFMTRKHFKWCYMPGLLFSSLNIIYMVYCMFTLL